MSQLVQSIEGMVEAGMKGLMGLAEGVLSPTSSSQDELSGQEDGQAASVEVNEGNVPPPQPSKPLTIPQPTSSTPVVLTAMSGSKLNLPKQEQLIQIMDVPSGWIHLQSTYLDGDVGHKKVRSFGLRNIAESEVEVEIESDLTTQLIFWLGEEENSTSSSASSTSSSSTSAGSPSLHITLPPATTITIFFAFQPSHSVPATTPIDSAVSPIDDIAYTPRVKPVSSRTHSSEVSPVIVGSPSDGRSSELSSMSGGSSQAGSVKGFQSSRRPEPVHRSFSVHGSITIRAITSSVLLSPDPPHAPPTVSHQTINLPFFATVCRSLFTAAPMDPVQGLVIGSQISSGEMIVDFGNNSVVGGRYHRDILLVNRSEIELVWKTTVVSSPFKEAVWFELRDLDSENVFGVDHSSRPVPLPSLSSRHLRLEMRAKGIVQDNFDFTFLISNVNQSGNVISCKAVGTILPSKSDDSLAVLSGNNLDFGQVLDGTWSKQTITCKNNGGKPIDVKFSATEGYDVVFRLAGVAGEDLDEDLHLPFNQNQTSKERQRSGSAATSGTMALTRSSTKESSIRGREPIQQQQFFQQPRETRDTRAESPLSTTYSRRSKAPSSIYSSEALGAKTTSVPGDFGRPWTVASPLVDVDRNSAGGISEACRDHSQPPSRPLSRVTSRTSSYLMHTGDEMDGESIEDEDEDFEPPFFGGGATISNIGIGNEVTSHGSSMLHVKSSSNTSFTALTNEQVIPNQIEEVTMRPGTEYRIYVLHRPAVDKSSPPEVAGRLRRSNFKVHLETISGTAQHSRSTSNNLSSKDSSSTASSKQLSMSSTTTSSIATGGNRKISINCTIEHCSSFISLPEGKVLDFGKVTVGASKTLSLKIQNLSDLSTKIEIATISKVINLSSAKNIVVIPPGEIIEERLEFFPRRINERYEKECFVRNLLNRGNDQVVEIRSQNVDVYNLTLHSHLYRILTPSGSNFLDFGNVVINAPTVRTMHLENLSNTKLVLDLYASQPEDVELYIKAEDIPSPKTMIGPNRSTAGYSENESNLALERMISPPNGELKERFMETLQELSEKNSANGGVVKSKINKVREKSVTRAKKEEGDKEGKSVGQQVAVALKKGGRGRPVQLYGNSVVFKDRNLLEPHEYLDLASGPPVCAHRSPRAKRFTLLDTIELEDKTKLSGKHDKVPKLDFAAVAKASGLVGKEAKEAKTKKKHSHVQHNSQTDPKDHRQVASDTPSNLRSPKQSNNASSLTSPQPKSVTVPPTHNPSPVSIPPANSSNKPDMHLNLATLASQVMQRIIPETGGRKSPALTAKRPVDLKMTENTSNIPSDPSKMSIDELLLAIEQNDSIKSKITHSTLEEEEAYVRKTIALKKELNNVITSGKLIPARTVSVDSKKTKAVIVVMTPNGSTRPHVGIRAKRADSRVFIKLLEFDKSLLNEAGRGLSSEQTGQMDEKLIEKITLELPIRDLIIRSSCVRSVLEVQQSSINFGGCDKGEVRSKTIVIHNKSDTLGLFRLRTSGSIASGDLKLGLGRYGVISAFGRKEVPTFSFTPSLTGNYQESITIENVLDSYNDQSVSVKAVVRKIPAFKAEPSTLDFGIVNLEACGSGTTMYDSIDRKSNDNDKKGKNKQQQSFILTNISKHDKTFVITLNGIPSTSFAQINLIRDENDVGIALSKTEEEEVEGIMQKLKIARRKKKKEKIEKYTNRLIELGVQDVDNSSFDGEAEVDGELEDDDEDKSDKGKKDKKKDKIKEKDNIQSESTQSGSPKTSTSLMITKETTETTGVERDATPAIASQSDNTSSPSPQACVTTLNLTLAPNQKTKILVELSSVPQPPITVGDSSTIPGGGDYPAINDVNEDDIKATITIHDKRNTDETISITVNAIKGTPENTQKETMEKAVKMADRAKNTTSVSPTAFCVGSTLFLPSSSKHYTSLASTSKFDPFPSAYGSPKSSTPGDISKGLILGDGWSRQIPGNTHAEANALTNFRTKYGELQASFGGWGNNPTSSEQTVSSDANPDVKEPSKTTLPGIEEVLKDADCYATMEPCSVRTSGGPSCALELVRAGVKAVYLGVEEPPDFVQCEGVKILEDGGVKVIRTSGLEEACLKAARRGRN
uniref:Abnormal spindle-like microcephaly-associated protein ASH domain-containing protein n=1 Tax=Kwoniella pini CBS 10737 TaxID=1296096 RepID=A0A1B9I3E1_9TREE|nr:uncharacterized protein I206_03373 [Kwoniella pini CBS 10737]OCF50057.1 hypothetical protein I206_03373 [Kwoniella pini CBS 10737]